MSNKTAIIFGEVLFDVFEGGQAVLGGAPFNVAWHLHGFGAKTLFVSRIGQDQHAEQILETMRAWGMNCDGIQQDAEHPTGMVQVLLNDGEPEYEICESMAYDYIDKQMLDNLIAKTPAHLIYHGSLISRNECSRASLLSLRQAEHAPVFVDINLRAPWHERETAEPLLKDIQWLKLNRDELEILSQQSCASPESAEKAARELLEQYQLEFIIVTLGHKGAFCLDDEYVYHTTAPATEDLVDTVGAGDALSSVIILGILNQWKIPVSLQRGVEFAAAICRQQGATQSHEDLYRSFRKNWQME